jgi:predicted O-methyltransferase YrrM
LPREIDWNLDGQLEVVRKVGKFVDELSDIPSEPGWRQKDFYWNNEFWNNADALVQYGLVREYAPKRIVEIGCGFSSLLLKRALRANMSACKVDLVDRFLNPRVFSQIPDGWTHHECSLQRAPLDMFEKLEAGDICFYDGSHCVRTGSDVNWFFFEVMPRLAPGVLIHLHDILLPEPYPDQWLFDRHQSWNEQFLLQAFLMHNEAYEIVIANRYIWCQSREFVEQQYKGIQPGFGCSFWLTKKQ